MSNLITWCVLCTVFLPFVGLGTVSTATKRGLGESYPEYTSADVSLLETSWGYDWSPRPVGYTNYEAVPMTWGLGDMGAVLGGNSQWLMGFNEPDNSGQANLTPAQAAVLWRQIEQQYPNRKLVAPVPAIWQNSWINIWYYDYWEYYGRPPRIDALAAHCYGHYASECVPTVEYFKYKAQAWGIAEIWVTEWAMLPCDGFSMEHAVSEMRIFRQYLDSQPMVTRYAWFNTRTHGDEGWAFPGCNTSLVDWNTGQPTPLGEAYND